MSELVPYFPYFRNKSPKTRIFSGKSTKNMEQIYLLKDFLCIEFFKINKKINTKITNLTDHMQIEEFAGKF